MLGKHEVAGPTPASSSTKEGRLVPSFFCTVEGRARNGDRIAQRRNAEERRSAIRAVACNCIGRRLRPAAPQKKEGLCLPFFVRLRVGQGTATELRREETQKEGLCLPSFEFIPPYSPSALKGRCFRSSKHTSAICRAALRPPFASMRVDRRARSA